MSVYTDAERVANTLRAEERSDAADAIDALLAYALRPEHARAALYAAEWPWRCETDGGPDQMAMDALRDIAELGQIAGDR